MLIQSNINIKRMQPLLGTYVEIAVFGSQFTYEQTQTLMNFAFNQIKLIQDLMSFYDVSSDLSRINRSHGRWIRVHDHTFKVMQLARRIMQFSGGAFNCTVGAALVNARALPALDLILNDYNDFAQYNCIDLKNGHVRLNKKVLITLDGIAKGYAIDLAMSIFSKDKFQSICINAGGDLKVRGNLELPIQQRESNHCFSAIPSISNAAVASSWVKKDFEKNFPGHLVGCNGNSVKNGIYTVSASRAWLADALTKVAAFADPLVCQRLFSKYKATLLRSPA